MKKVVDDTDMVQNIGVKKEWINEKCAKIERMLVTDKADMHKEIREIAEEDKLMDSIE